MLYQLGRLGDVALIAALIAGGVILYKTATSGWNLDWLTDIFKPIEKKPLDVQQLELTAAAKKGAELEEQGAEAISEFVQAYRESLPEPKPLPPVEYVYLGQDALPTIQLDAPVKERLVYPTPTPTYGVTLYPSIAGTITAQQVAAQSTRVATFGDPITGHGSVLFASGRRVPFR